jgi:peptide/nickel transport system substrate-binding protein
VGRLLLVALIGIALSISASSCTSASSGSSTTTSTTTPALESSATVVVAVSSLPTNFNPSTPVGANQITAEVMEQVWPQMFVTNGELAATTEPGFLQSAEVENVSPFTVVYTLNPKAVWSDGKPIGLADFVYNWHEQVKWAPRLPDSGLAAGYRDITGISASSGGSTISVRFSHPFSEWEALFSDLVPAQVAEAYGWVSAFQGFDPTKVISGGPFEITSYVPGVSLELSRNPHYWSTRARVAHIILKVETPSKALQDLEQGGVGVIETAAGPAVDDVIAEAALYGVSLEQTTSELPTLWQLCFNTTAPYVSSAAFRTAVEHSLDLDEITADSVGLEDTSMAPYLNRLMLVAGSQSGAASTGLGNGLASPGAPGSSGVGSAGSGSITAAAPGVYDLAAALSHFAVAGYAESSGGVLRSVITGDRVRVSLVVPRGDSVLARAAAVIQGELAAVGVTVVLRPVPLDRMLASVLPKGKYQMALAPFLLSSFAAGQIPTYSTSVLPSSSSSDSSSSFPTTSPTSTTSSTGKPSRSSGGLGVEPGAVEAGVVTRNVFGVDDLTVTLDLSKALANPIPGDDLSLIADANTALWSELPTIPLFQVPIDLVHASSIKSLSESPTWAGIFWNAELWAVAKGGQAPPPSPAAPAS